MRTWAGLYRARGEDMCVLIHDHATMEQVNFELEEYVPSSYQTHLIIPNSTLTCLPFIYIFVYCQDLIIYLPF